MNRIKILLSIEKLYSINVEDIKDASQAFLGAPLHTAIKSLVLIARKHGVDVGVERLTHDYALDEEPTTPRLLRIAQDLGLKARLKKFQWNDLARIGKAYPVIARLDNGNSVIVTEFRHIENGKDSVMVLDPLADRAELLVLDQETFEGAWSGDIILLKPASSLADPNQPFGFKWFIPEILNHKGTFINIGIAALVMHVLALSTPIYIQITLDKVIGNQSYDTLYVLSVGVVLALVFNAIIEFLRGLLLVHATSKIDIRVSTRTFSKLVSLPINFFKSTSAGVLTKHMQQVSTVREFLTGRIFLTLLDMTVLFVYVPILYFYSPLLTAVVLGFSTAIAAISLAIRGPYRSRLQKLYEAEGQRQALLVESIAGMETIKALSMEPMRKNEWDQSAAQAVNTQLSVSKISLISRSLSGLLQKLMGVSIIFIGALMVFSGDLTVGAIIAFNMLSARVTGPLVAAVGLINEYQQSSLAVKMLGNVMNHKSERTSSSGLTPPIKGAIEFEDISFRYSPEDTLALDKMSFKIDAGKFVGIVGRSGGGKSTVTRLLQGLYPPHSGIIRIDGVDMREIDLAHVRLNTGVVLQESFLFRGTVRENIGVTRPDAAFQEIDSAARLAGASEFIERLPQGYDTMLEEGASNLSGGQKQRLSIARALLRNPAIMIFDEATSALDPESEKIIQNNMREIAAGRTVFSVSHRLSTLVHADSIIVVDAGKIVDMAPHKVLLARCEIYKTLWDKQNDHNKLNELAAE